ncbi:MAG: hypothetical protein ACFFDF_15780 [Candidatus Odinarchaeota archaeon]
MKREKSLEQAFKKILYKLHEQSVNQITIQRKYLPEIFSADLLKISEDDGLPILFPFVLEFFKRNGISIKVTINEVQFEAIQTNYERKKQLETKYNLLKLKDEQIKTLEKTLKTKDEETKTLEKTIALKEEELRKLVKIIEFKEREIKELREKLTEK